MATPATSLLADFDFDLTPRAEAPPPVPPRPPTPDPRRTPTPRLQRPLYRSVSSFSTDNNRRRLRKKPTAIFVGQQTENRSPSFWPCADDVEPLNGHQYHSHHTLSSLLPLFPSTPSPRFAASPSLSSGGSTIQSSPTVTPTTAHFSSSYNESRPTANDPTTLDPWEQNESKYGLRRAKRLPHRDQGLWEVHAVVHIGEGEKGSGSSGSRLEHEQQSDHYNWCLQQQQQSGILETGPAKEPLIGATLKTPHARTSNIVKRRTTNSDTRPKGFHGIFSESTRREGGLRKVSEVPSSTYTLSKFHFPAPPGDYRIGLSGDLQHPAKIHYRGASFDLVNPHASLLLCSSQFETPAEIEGLLDDYFEDPEAMPRALYPDTETARRDIMGLGEVEEPAGPATNSHESSTSSLVPPRVPSDPFDLRVTDVPCQAANPSHGSAGRASTLADIVDDYDYTREVPFEHEETLRALESGSSATHSDEVFSQLSEAIQQHMSAELSERAFYERALSEKASELPTSERTYGDTNQLLNLTPAQRVADASVATNAPNDEHETYMRPAPRVSTTETTFVEPRLQSATASVHSIRSQYGLPGSRSVEIPRGGHYMHMEDREMSEATIRSDMEGDWETTKSESQIQLLHGHTRPSQDSYANTSTYEEGSRLSVLSDSLVADLQSSRPYRAAPGAINDVEDVEKAKVAMSKMYKDKVLEHDSHANYSRDVLPRSGTAHTRDFQIFRESHGRRTSAQARARNNDIELEEIRKRNPSAVRLAADQLYAKNTVPQEQPRRVPRSATPMERLSAVRGVFSPRHRLVLANQRIMNDVIAEERESNRNLLVRTPTRDGFSSRLEFSESVNTFRTFRNIGRTLTPSDYNSRSGLDLGERPVTPMLPATAYSPIANPGHLPPFAPDPRAHDRARAPPRHVRRAAMSSQTSLRALITSGSPTSNIQGAFTDREMAEASRRWDPFPRRQTYNQRFHSRNASARYPQFVASPAHRSNAQGRMLVRPNEVLDPGLQVLQERFSHSFLMRMLVCPPMCLLYYWGHYDYMIAKKTDGRIKAMSASKKEDALAWAVLLTIVYAFIIVGIITAVAINRHE